MLIDERVPMTAPKVDETIIRFINREREGNGHWSDSPTRIARHTNATSSELLTATKRFPIRSISVHPQLFFVEPSRPRTSTNCSDPGRPDNRSITKSRNSCVSLVHQDIS